MEEYTVLLVEDDLISIKLFESHLKKLNIAHVLSANNGLQGLDLIQERDNKIDLIFLDINMPTMDGIEFLRHLVELNFNGSIVIVSGEEDGIISMVKRLSEIHHFQCLGSLKKPAKFEELKGFIEILITPEEKRPKIQDFNLESTEILRGIHKGQLIIYYQPKITLHSKEVIGAEALVRWQHPKLGLLSPDNFIPPLIESKQSLALTKVVISQAMSEMANLLSMGPSFTLSMNITVQDLNWLDMPSYIKDQANAVGIHPKQLCFELTETELINNLKSALEILAKLRLYGFRLSIDDFGTGFSNLEKLELIKFDEIKIDKFFVHNSHLNPTAQAILKSSCLLGKSLNMLITAEGIEHATDEENMLALGVDQGQGYFYSKPLPFDKFIDFCS